MASGYNGKVLFVDPSSGSIKEEYIFTASTTDIDFDKIYYLFDWGDGNFSGWLGPVSSGKTIEASHIWIERGTYEIRVQARDVHGLESEWSDPLTVSMPRTKAFNQIPKILIWLFERFPFLQSYIPQFL